MQSADLNLLLALDTLLREQSVSASAAKLGLSAPAMSRTLQRARRMMRDPLLIRAGNRLVPTPRALEIKARLQSLIEEARSLVKSEPERSLSQTDRIFTIRADESFAVAFAAELRDLIQMRAPSLRLRFLGVSDNGVEALRDGDIDLEISPNPVAGPELKVQLLHRIKFVGAVRAGHSLSKIRITPERFAAAAHIAAGRKGKLRGPIDGELEKLGLTRTISLWVPTFFPALVAAARSDMIANVPDYFAPAAKELLGLQIFPIPLSLPTVAVNQTWHPRLDADPTHRFVRECVKRICR